MAEPIERNARNVVRPRSAAMSEAALLLEKLLRSGMINPLSLAALPETARHEVAHLTQGRQLLARLVTYEILTAYQADRIRSGKVQGLLLGNYRVLDRLGAGNDGVVFRGEHRETAQKVAIKVLIPARDEDPKPMLRFLTERKTVGQLNHPGIVRALDVGQTTPDDAEDPVLHYYVMEHVPGLDLEQHVQKHGPMAPSLACDVAFQVADALTEAHKHELVHRDIKPSNVLLTPDGRAMLLDFGLVRRFDSRQTKLGSLVGMLEWIAPEQVRDAHAVDIRADIYSLGCVLYWCLTAQSPFGANGSPRIDPGTSLSPPPSLRSVFSDLAPELDAVVTRMLAPQPGARYPNPMAVMAALAPFVSEKYAQAGHVPAPAVVPELAGVTSTARILVVDGDPATRSDCRAALRAEGIDCAEHDEGETVLQAASAAMPDLVLVSMDLPGSMSGLELLKQLRQLPDWGTRKVIMLINSSCDIRPMLLAGADDYLTKPINTDRLLTRVKSALEFKDSQDEVQNQPPEVPPEPEPTVEVQPPGFARTAMNWLLRRKNPDTETPPPE